MTNDQEEWVYISGTDRRYRISNHGRIYSETNQVYMSGKVRDNKSVVMVTLVMDDGEKYSRSIARLVMEHFSDNYCVNKMVMHRDGDNWNNHINNLYYSERNITRRTIRRWPRASKVECVETGKVYSSAVEAADDIGGHSSLIYACLRGDQDTHMGYHFRIYREPVIVYNSRTFDDYSDPWVAPTLGDYS